MISRLKYYNEESSKSNKKIQEQLFNTSSQELNDKLRSVANSKNDITTSPDITTSKNEDFPVSSTSDHKTQIAMVFNIMINY